MMMVLPGVQQWTVSLYHHHPTRSIRTIDMNVNGWYTWWAYILIECFGIKCPDRRTEYGGGGQMDMIFTSQWTCSGWLLNALVQPIYNCDILETIDHLIKYPEYWSMFIESSFVITVLGK